MRSCMVLYSNILTDIHLMWRQHRLLSVRLVSRLVSKGSTSLYLVHKPSRCRNGGVQWSGHGFGHLPETAKFELAGLRWSGSLSPRPAVAQCCPAQSRRHSSFESRVPELRRSFSGGFHHCQSISIVCVPPRVKSSLSCPLLYPSNQLM